MLRLIAQGRAVLVPHRPVHRRRRARHPAPDLLALLDQGDARPRPDRERRAGARRLFTQGMVIKDGAKMSKSKGNVVSPDDMVARYGADATRMYALFAAPPDRDLDWQEDGVAGVSRFLGRVWRLVTKYAPLAREGRSRRREAPSGLSLKLLRKLHQTIAKITLDFRRAAGTSTPA